MNALITESLETGELHLLFGFPQELLNPVEKKMIKWVIAYTSKYNQPPSILRFTRQFGATFVPVHTSDPLQDIYDQTLKEYRNIFTREYLMGIQDELKKGADPLPLLDSLHEVIRKGSSDITRYSTYDRTAYQRKPTSYPYEIPDIDVNTGGIAAGDLIYLIGRLGTGKTTFALWVVSKWLQRGRTILMVSNENRADDVVAKIDSYIGGFNPLKKRTMGWSTEDENRLRTVSFIAKNMDGEVYIPNKPVRDVAEVQSLIYTHRPDIVVVDGIYLMQGASGDSHWEKITGVSRSLKQLAEGEGLPVLGIHQANRQAVGRRIEVEHIAYADALAQDADLVLGINPEDDGSTYVESIKNRWGKQNWGFYLNFFFDTMSVRIRKANLNPKEK